MNSPAGYALEVKNVSKKFPGVLALNKVSFRLRTGTVHALMGENGAGKSTLIKCLCGLYNLDEGSISINGNDVKFSDFREALELGVSIVQQELSPVMDLTVMENIWLGREQKKTIFIDYKQMYRDTVELLNYWDLNLNPKDKLSMYTVANIQMVEILKAASRNAKIIIMDEPTSALSNKEVDKLFEIIRRLKAQGISFIYVSHKMDEIFKIADDITVLRDGNYIATHRSEDTNMEQLIHEMVGRDIENFVPPIGRDIGNVVMKVTGLSAGKAFQDVSFALKKGEILGISGLIGAGRTEVLETIFGLRKIKDGSVELFGKNVNIDSPEKAIGYGMAMITEERRSNGIIPLMTITDNVTLATIPKYKEYLLFFNKNKAKADALEYVKLLRVKVADMDDMIANLSGGNQQKVIVARWLMSEADIFLFDEPTRGIDVGAKSEIHDLIYNLTKQGKSVIVVSSEMPEIIKLSDRIIVMREGKITGELSRGEASEERIMSLAAVK